jgi:alpha-tubulin suppressor-like RCC1 family protein
MNGLSAFGPYIQNGLAPAYAQARVNSSIISNASISITPEDDSELRLIRGRGTLTTDTANVQSGDSIGSVKWQGFSTNTIRDCAEIKATVDGSPINDNVPTKIDITTTSSTDGNQVRMTVKPDGFVGIGTTTPSERLTVFGNISSNGNITNIGNINSTGSITASEFNGDGSGLTNLNYQKAFLKFKNQDNSCAAQTLYRINSFLSKGRRLYYAGYAGPNDYIPLRDAGYSRTGFQEVAIDSLDVNEQIEDYYLTSQNAYVLTNFNRLHSIGDNSNGQLGINSTATNSLLWSVIPNLNNISWFSGAISTFALAARFNYQDSEQHCLLINNGQLYGWGNNVKGAATTNGYRLGITNASPVRVPTLITSTAFAGKTLTKAFACGSEYTNTGHSFVVDSDRNLYATGDNATGQLGFGATDTAGRNTFSQVIGIKCDKLRSKSFSTKGTTYVLDGTNLYACGDNTYGQLKLANTTTYRGSFGLIESSVLDFESYSYFNGGLLILKTDGTLLGLGANAAYVDSNTASTTIAPLGNTPNAINTSFITPRAYTDNTNTTNVPLSNLATIIKIRIIGESYLRRNTANTANVLFSCPTTYALGSGGNLWATGYNGSGQIGDGSTTDSIYFKKAIKPKGIRFIDFEAFGGITGTGVLAVDQYGDLWSWGSNGEFSCGINHADALNSVSIPRRCHVT